MESWGSLSLSNILRHCIAGICFLSSVFVLNSASATELKTWLTKAEVGGATFVIAGAFFVGTLIYAVHRAIIFPFIQVFMRWDLSRYGRTNRFPPFILISDDTLDLDWRRMKDRQLPEKNGSNSQWLAAWADQVHMMYTCVWAILMAGVVGYFNGARVYTNWAGGQLLLAAIVLGVAAGFSNRRYLIAEYKMLWFGRATSQDTAA